MIAKTMTPILLAATLSVLALPSAATRSDATTTAKAGVVRCGGTNHLRLGGTEMHFTSYPLRNFDGANGISLDRVRMFDAAGAVIFDSQVSGLPLSDNGIVGPANNVIPPNATVQFDSFQMTGFLAQNLRPIQVEIQWSAPTRVLTLDAVTVRIVRTRDPSTGNVLEERSRHAVECRSVSLR